MNACTNDELGEGIELFPEDLQDAAAIFLFVEDNVVHLHQGADCVVIVGSLLRRFIDFLELVRGVTQ